MITFLFLSPINNRAAQRGDSCIWTQTQTRVVREPLRAGTGRLQNRLLRPGGLGPGPVRSPSRLGRGWQGTALQCGVRLSCRGCTAPDTHAWFLSPHLLASFTSSPIVGRLPLNPRRDRAEIKPAVAPEQSETGNSRKKEAYLALRGLNALWPLLGGTKRAGAEGAPTRKGGEGHLRARFRRRVRLAPGWLGESGLRAAEAGPVPPAAPRTRFARRLAPAAALFLRRGRFTSLPFLLFISILIIYIFFPRKAGSRDWPSGRRRGRHFPGTARRAAAPGAPEREPEGSARPRALLRAGRGLAGLTALAAPGPPRGSLRPRPRRPRPPPDLPRRGAARPRPPAPSLRSAPPRPFHCQPGAAGARPRTPGGPRAAHRPGAAPLGGRAPPSSAPAPRTPHPGSPPLPAWPASPRPAAGPRIPPPPPSSPGMPPASRRPQQFYRFFSTPTPPPPLFPEEASWAA